MLETPRQSIGGSQELNALLASATLREKRSRKKAIAYTLVPVIVGLAFLGFSLRKVSRLERTAGELNLQIESKTAELSRKKDELTSLETKVTDAENKLKTATIALNDIEKGQANPQQKARQALQVINRPPVLGSNPTRPSTSQVTAPVPAVGSSTSIWVIAIGAGRDLETARGFEQRARALGYAQVSICLRQGMFRAVVEFSSKGEAYANLSKISSNFAGSYPRDWSQWCPNPKMESGFWKCQD